MFDKNQSRIHDGWVGKLLGAATISIQIETLQISVEGKMRWSKWERLMRFCLTIRRIGCHKASAFYKWKRFVGISLRGNCGSLFISTCVHTNEPINVLQQWNELVFFIIVLITTFKRNFVQSVGDDWIDQRKNSMTTIISHNFLQRCRMKRSFRLRMDSGRQILRKSFTPNLSLNKF